MEGRTGLRWRSSSPSLGMSAAPRSARSVPDGAEGVDVEPIMRFHIGGALDCTSLGLGDAAHHGALVELGGALVAPPEPAV